MIPACSLISAAVAARQIVGVGDSQFALRRLGGETIERIVGQRDRVAAARRLGQHIAVRIVAGVLLIRSGGRRKTSESAHVPTTY